MVSRRAFLVFVGAASLLAAVPALPHHSFAAEFDVNRPVKLTGTVTRMEWTNPHAWLFIDTKDDNGNVQSWAIELVGINVRSLGHFGNHGRAALGQRSPE